MGDEQLLTYRQQIDEWRRNREKALTAPDGWLSLTGLFMLQEGEQRVGSAAGSEVLLPPSAPAHLGIITFRQERATLAVCTETPVFVDGEPVQFVDLVDNSRHRQPTIVTSGTVSFFVHRFGDVAAIRVRDSSNPAIQSFAGCEWFAVDPAYCVKGKLVRSRAPVTIAVENSVNTPAEYQSIGVVEFTLGEMPLQLLASAGGKAGELFIIFRDRTTGRSTYGAGRYMYPRVDAVDNVTLDFNKAYNPPCAFTPYATCSYAPAANYLPISIMAGERY